MASGMSFPDTQKSSFLSFISSCGNGVLTDLILSYVGQDPGAYVTLLNLRKVCSTTKSWIDDFRPAQLLKHFPQIKVSITLCRKNLADFLQSPPSFNVSTLQLHNTDYLNEKENDHSAEEKKLIRLFAKHWHNKLETLEVKDLTGNIMDHFGSSITLRSICCESLEKLFPRLFELKQLSVKSFKGLFDAENSFFTQMLSNKNLKRLEFSGSVSCLEGISALLDSKKNDRKFKLVLNLGFLNRHSDLQDDLLRKFVSSVASSCSCIHLLRVNDYLIHRVLRVTRDDEEMNKRKNFLDRVEWIEFQYYQSTEWFAELMRCKVFANLKRLDEDSFHLLPQHMQGNMEELLLPMNLTHLTVSSKLFLPNEFPKALKYLNLYRLHFNVSELQDILMKISDNCLQLEELKITWYCVSNLTQYDVHPQLRDKSIFENIKSLSCNVIYPFPNNLESTQRLLMEILKINTLKIQDLKIEGNLLEGHIYPVTVGTEFFTSIMGGLVSESLLSLSYNKDVVFVEEATVLMDELNKMMENNFEKLQKKCGRKIKRNVMEGLYE